VNSGTLKLGMAFNGQVKGTTLSPTVTASSLGASNGSNIVVTSTKQLIDKATNSFTIAAGGTTTIDLTSGQLNPLGEAVVMARVFAVMVIHDAASESSGIEVFGGASSNKFQGPLDSAGKLTLKPKQSASFAATSADTVGWVVSGSAKNIDIKNNDGVKAATVRFVVVGATT
jgi:hypothetical protein